MAKKKKNTFQQGLFTLVLAVIVVGVFAYLIVTDESVDQDLVATVNGEPISQSELDEEYSKLPPEYQLILTKEALLDQLIQRNLLLQEAENQDIEIEDAQEQIENLKLSFPSEEDFIARLDAEGITEDELESQLIVQGTIQELLRINAVPKLPTEDEVFELYLEDLSSFVATEDQIKASHILVATEEEALAAISQLERGTDFNELAVLISIDPSAQFNGGDLGFFGPGQMVQPFEEAAFSLDVDEVSEPIQTQFGFHVIKRLSNEMSFDEAKPLIEKSLLESRQTEAIEEYIKELESKAEIILLGAEEQNEFINTNDELCTELDHDEPHNTVRFYSASNCESCEDALNMLQNTLTNYDLIMYAWELDTGDNLNTIEVEKFIPKNEFEFLEKYNPDLGVPAYNLGCRFIRIGNAFSEFDYFKEQEALIEALDKLESLI